MIFWNIFVEAPKKSLRAGIDKVLSQAPNKGYPWSWRGGGGGIFPVLSVFNPKDYMEQNYY